MRPEDSGTGSASALAGGEAMYESHNNLLSEQRAAESLNLSVASLRRYRQQGGGPVYVQLSPGRVAYDPADLKAWRAARKASNTAEGAKLGARGVGQIPGKASARSAAKLRKKPC